LAQDRAAAFAGVVNEQQVGLFILDGETETAEFSNEVSEIVDLLLDVLVGRVCLVGLVRPEPLDALEGDL
jgi:hypothetical protein